MLLWVGLVGVAGGLFVLGLALLGVRQQVTGGAAVVAAGAPRPPGRPGRGAVAADDDEPAVPRAGLGYRAAEPLLDAAARLALRLSPAARRDLIARRLVYAGLESTVTVERVFGAKAGAALLGAVLGAVIHLGQLPWVLVAVGLGVAASFVPDVLLDSRARARQEKVGRALPDALDLLAITVEAGLGLEQGLTVVTERLTGPLGEELRRLLGEIDLGVSRRDALTLLRERTDVSELSSFIVALLQADELGLSVAEVLKVQAAQVRLVRVQRARERAAQTPVKILFPLVLGIFPAIFVVAIGPGAITIAHSLLHH